MRKIVLSIILITSLASPRCGYMSHLHVMFGLADMFLLVLNNYIFDTSTPAGKSWHKADRIAHKAELICADLDLLLRLLTPSLLGNHEATLMDKTKHAGLCLTDSGPYFCWTRNQKPVWLHHTHKVKTEAAISPSLGRFCANIISIRAAESIISVIKYSIDWSGD